MGIPGSYKGLVCSNFQLRGSHESSGSADGDWAKGRCWYFMIQVIQIKIQLERPSRERRGLELESGTLMAPILLFSNTVLGFLFTRIHQDLLGAVEV